MNKTYIILYLISVLIASISQILLKKSAKNAYSNKIKEYINPLVILAYIMLAFSTILTTLAYRGIPLSSGQILESTGYIYIIVLSRILLKEKITKRVIIGNIFIIIGIIIYTF